MKISVLKARMAGEKRVAVTPDAVRKYVQLGVEVTVEKGAGVAAAFTDADYKAAGAHIAASLGTAVKGTALLLAVHAPDEEICAALPEGCLVAGMLAPNESDALLPHYATNKLTTFTLELLPRISRAQSMDVLSSQSNLAGYRAVIEAVHAMEKVVPMMMTAAGTVVPAKALVLGAGVAGLQAIATAKRLGAVVSAFDVRPAVKEQVQSLGAKFIEVPSEEEGGEASGGYAKEMSEEYKQRQQQLIHDTIIKQDIVITTALIPGRPAPVLITEAMVEAMKPGSVIVDLAAIAGGNCPLTEPDKVIKKHGVTLIGYTNLPSHTAGDASQLYARNLYNFVSTLLLDKEGKLAPNWEDELITGTMLTKDGQAVHARYKG